MKIEDNKQVVLTNPFVKSAYSPQTSLAWLNTIETGNPNENKKSLKIKPETMGMSPSFFSFDKKAEKPLHQATRKVLNSILIEYSKIESADTQNYCLVLGKKVLELLAFELAYSEYNKKMVTWSRNQPKKIEELIKKNAQLSSFDRTDISYLNCPIFVSKTNEYEIIFLKM